MKEIVWNDKAREFVKSLEPDTKREIGTLLLLLQRGHFLGMPQSKPMKNIHKNAHELRIKDRKGTYRVIYILNVGDKILIPHAFTKKTQKTSFSEIEITQRRLSEML